MNEWPLMNQSKILSFNTKHNKWISTFRYADLLYLLFVPLDIQTLPEKCPNTELFLVRIFLYWDLIRRFTVNLRIQSKCRKIRARNISVFGHFSRIEIFSICYSLFKSPGLIEIWENMTNRVCILLGSACFQYKQLTFQGHVQVIDYLKSVNVTQEGYMEVLGDAFSIESVSYFLTGASETLLKLLKNDNVKI